MKRFVFLALAGTLFAPGILKAAAVTVSGLRCEDRVNPLGIDVAVPRFSWILNSTVRGENQTAYEVVVDGQWDSGKVTSSECLHVEYGGPALPATKSFTWKVRVWDANGAPSDWSPVATFSTGLTDWTAAKWIGRDEVANADFFGTAKWIWYPEGDPTVSAPVGSRFFKRTLTLTEKPSKATYVLAADNGFQLFINGVKAGEGSDFSSPTSLDVASLLNVGDNTIAITASNIGTGANPAGLIARLRAEFPVSTALDFFTDAQWSASIDGTTWVTAKALGSYGMAPWGTLNTRPLPARYLRKEFAADAQKTVTRATAYVCGMGFFDLSVNGQPVSDHVMDPALSDYTKAAYYVTFDVTGQMTTGINAIGVTLGNGRFLAPRFSSPAPTVTYGFPKLLLQLEVEYSDGSKSKIVSDATWKITDKGPIRANNEYDGETYDARMEMPGWNAANFDDSDWYPVQLVAAPGGVLKSQIIDPMTFTQVIHPVAVTTLAPGKYIVDMGQSFYGTVRLKATGPAGTTVDMVSAYSIDADGSLKTADNRSAQSHDRYTMKGGGPEVWNPRFKGQGYRRIQVTGFPGVPTVDNFEGLVIHNAAVPVGDFTCSNPLINQIHSAVTWGLRSFLRSAPLDPDRDERQSWMGDPAKDAESGAYNYNVAPFYTKWMDDVERSQHSDGTIPDVSMFWTFGEGVDWASVFTIIPDWFTTFYDDKRVADSHYNAMKAWVLAEQQRHVQPDGTLNATSYGDWCDTSTMDMGGAANSSVTPGELVSTAYHYNNCRILQRLAQARGAATDQQTFTAMADALKTAFNAKFFNPTTNMYQGDSQCGYVLAIKFGLVPDGKLDAVVSNLATNIMVKNTGHLSVGLIGMQWLMQTLTDVGRSDLAWTIATQTSRPSWGYMLSRGSTTIWERWDGDTESPSMNSEDLLILAGNLDAWFYQTLAGIRPVTPGFKTFLIKPEILGDLKSAVAHFDSPYGRIASDWNIDTATHLSLACTVPANTTATIAVPLTKLTNATISEGGTVIWSNGTFINGVTGISYDGADATSARFVVGSGSYAFSVTGTAVVPPVTVDPIVVDDDGAGATYTGSWTRSTTTEVTQRYGPSFRYASAGTGTSTAVFRPNLPVAGIYQVFAWWTTNPNRATNSPFTVHNLNGDTRVFCNQEINGGTWNSLGTFSFNAGTGGYVTLTNAANEYVIADAVQFVLISPTTAFQSWTDGYYPASNDPAVTGLTADPDHDGMVNLAEFALNGAPNSSSNRGLSFPMMGSDASFQFVVAVRRGATFTAGANGSQTATITDAGLTYTIEGSQDLSFTDANVTHVSNSNTSPAATGLPDLTSSAWEYHTFHLTGSGGVPSKGFFRVRISSP
jgi:alpha-L-rhamnosidase